MIVFYTFLTSYCFLFLFCIQIDFSVSRYRCWELIRNVLIAKETSRWNQNPVWKAFLGQAWLCNGLVGWNVSKQLFNSLSFIEVLIVLKSGIKSMHCKTPNRFLFFLCYVREKQLGRFCKRINTACEISFFELQMP